MITKKTLQRWRTDALISTQRIAGLPKEGLTTDQLHLDEVNQRILRLTQILLDQHALVERKKL